MLAEKLRAVSWGASLQGTKVQLLERLVAVTEAQHAPDMDSPETTGSDPVLCQVFKTSFMKPLKAELQENCRRGHELEHPYIEEFFNCSRDGRTLGIQAHSVFTSPLVQRTRAGEQAILDSADGELVYTEARANSSNAPTNTSGSDTSPSQTRKVMPIECKACVAHSTFLQERGIVKEVLEAGQWDNDSRPFFFEVGADELRIFKLVPKESERIQLWHHATIRDAEKGLILIGNNQKLMRGVFVTYSNQIKAAYRQVLQDLHARGLEWAYGDPKQLPKEQIKHVLRSREMKGMKLDWHSFQTAFFIWRKLQIESLADGSVKVLLPPCSWILPYSHSFWNSTKGVSDTTTKLLWNYQILMPDPCLNTLVVGHFLQLFTVTLHRMFQIATANEDLSRYCSLYHFRNSRN